MLSGCDRFSLLEQFQFVGKGGPDSLTLTPSMSTLRPGESCELYPAGGTPPYYFSVSAPDLYSAGNPIDKGSIDADSDPARYVAGNSIGKVTIRLSDGKGKHVDTTVTVLPWEPKNFSVIRTTSPPKVKLHWEYEGVPGYIEGFLLFRAKGG